MQNNPSKEVIRVLFVDDEENVLRSLRRLFLDEDFEILTALSGKEGLEIASKNELAVIVSDQKMPEMAGFEFLEKTKHISPDSVRIILTGYADVNAAISAINKGGAYRYITKPWNDADLVVAIRDAAEKYRLLKENKYLTELTLKQNEELKKWSDELQYMVQEQTIDLSKQNKEFQNLNKKLKKNFREFLTAFSSLIELRDKTVRSHSNNVAILSSEVAQKMRLGSAEIETIRIAAQLHDIGKIGIADLVLMKDVEELSAEEMEEYSKHPIRGQAVIDSIDELRDAGVLIRHHHEWYNGEGFPEKLRGDKIPLGARIIAMADRFDRIIGTEVYSFDTAFTKIRSLLASQLDAGLYAVFEEIVRKNSRMFSNRTDAAEKELSLNYMKPGMILSRDVRSGTGLMLLRKDTVLNEGNIGILKRGYYLDPSKSGIYIIYKEK